MLGKLFAFALASIAVSLAATWLVPMVRQQKANGTFDRFMKHDDVEKLEVEITAPTTPVATKA